MSIALKKNHRQRGVELLLPIHLVQWCCGCCVLRLLKKPKKMKFKKLFHFLIYARDDAYKEKMRIPDAAAAMPGFIFVSTICFVQWKMVTFSRTHSHASTNATRRHKYFRGLSRLLPVPGVLVSFLELHFPRK